MEMNFEDVRNMKKVHFMNKVKRKIQQQTLKDLEKVKENHSKVRKLKYRVLKMQSYLMPNNLNMKKDVMRVIWKMKVRSTFLCVKKY